MIKLIKQFIYYIRIFQNYLGYKLYFSFFLIAIAGFAESTSIVLIPLVLGTIKEGKLIINNNFLNLIINQLSNFGLYDQMISLLIIIGLFFIIKGIFTFFAYSYAAYLRGKLIIKFKKNLLAGYSNMSYEYYLKNDIGNLVNIINEQSNRSVDAFKNLYDVGLKGINSSIYIVFAFSFSFSMGFLILLCSLIIFNLFKKVNTSTKNMSINTSTENGSIAKQIIQLLDSFKYLKSTNQIGIYNKKINKSIKSLASYHTKTGVLGGTVSASREPISISLIILIFSIEIYFLQNNFEVLLISAILYYRSLSSIVGIQGSWLNTQQLIGSNEILFKKINELKINFEKNGEKNIVKFHKNLVFSNVFFKYLPNQRYVIKNFNFCLEANSYIALIGKSGSGKSTLADLITLILKPQKGRIFIDEVETSQINFDSWRDQIGYVSQETIVFDDTIAKNISQYNFNSLEGKALERRIKYAAKLANIDEFINSLPNGYETVVGERGVRLSGGQKQRIFIARELFRKPKILILDEATSALDSQSEVNIQRSIDTLKGKITIVVIAHRLSTIKNVDRVLILDKGEIIEEGSFKNLSENDNSHLSSLIRGQNI